MLKALSSISHGPFVPPVSHNVDLEDLTSEDLIELAQVDLIGRRRGDAIIKLSQAVALGSSSGCELLANLLSKGLQGSTPTACLLPPPSSQHSTGSTSSASYCPTATPAAFEAILRIEKTPFTDSLAPAHLYIRGLELELNYHIYQCSVEPFRPVVANPSSTSSSSSGGGPPITRPVDIDKVLDLVTGLVDEYQYGRMRHDHDDPTYPDLWARGCRVAELAILHPDVITPRIKVLVAPSPRSGRPWPTVLPLASAQAHNRASADAEVPSRTDLSTPRSTNTRIRRKVVVTLQCYLLYLLALQAWHRDQGAAERYWEEIVDIAQDCGGHVGTRAGNKIVAKAMKRLARDSGFESWKREIDCTLGGLPSPTPSSSSNIDCKSNPTFQPSASTVLGGRSDITFTSKLACAEPSQSTSFLKPAHTTYGYPSPPESEQGSPPTVVVSLRIFNSLEEKSYTPDIGLRSPNATVDCATTRSLRRVASNTSIVFAPPCLIRRVASSSSLSTCAHGAALPHRVLGSTWTATCASPASGNHSSVVPTAPSRPAPARPATWAGRLRRRVSKLSIAAMFQEDTLPRPVPSTSAASSLLRQVLQRNDDAVACMWEDSDMLEDDHESEVYSVPSSPPTSPVVQKLRDNCRERSLLSRHRSYVRLPKVNEPCRLRYDSPPPAMRTPTCTVTPPTPTKEHLLPPRPPRRVRSSRSLRRAKIQAFESLPPLLVRGGADDFGSPKMGPIDPFLLELERNSRVGVATVCDGCGTTGLNYPACSRCDKKYCGRACRIGSQVRHSC